jgi:hypothetical protein
MKEKNMEMSRGQRLHILVASSRFPARVIAPREKRINRKFTLNFMSYLQSGKTMEQGKRLQRQRKW